MVSGPGYLQFWGILIYVTEYIGILLYATVGCYGNSDFPMKNSDTCSMP